ncbi:MAG: hypothetical protein DRI81_09220 [Chloroflexi bacterium]|nr:MAG: hypothetical protein DRI81_09220 [Chloroflexota bacterium]
MKQKIKHRIRLYRAFRQVGICAAIIAALTGALAAAGAAPAPARAEIPPHLGYGVNVRQKSSIDPLFAPLGFDWIKLWEEYEIDPPAERFPYYVLFTIDCRSGMPDDLDAWGDHIELIAEAGLGFIEAYEICNEPNVERFWSGQPPDPREYVQMLQVAYQRIRAVDPGAIVVSAGLAPVGRIQGGCDGLSGNDCHAMDEREYARVMFLWGAGDYFDAFGYHPYGFAYPPEKDPGSVSNGFAFRGAEVMHNLMKQYGLDHKPIWATEFSWLRDDDDYGGVPSDCNSDYEASFSWMEVSEQEQADYLTGAFQYADDNWPWMGPMFVWNLDWHDYHLWDCEAARYFSILKTSLSGQGFARPAPESLAEFRLAPNGTWYKLDTYHTLAYDALAAMEKRPGSFAPRLMITPDALTFLIDVDEPGVYTATLYPTNSGYQTLFWTASVATGLQVTPTLAITTGIQSAPLAVTVDTTGYVTGTFTGSISVTATTSDVLDSPQVIPVTLRVVPEVYRVYLPVALRSAP